MRPLSLLDSRAGTALLAMAAFALPIAARAQVAHHDFEDGTTQGRVRRGTAILAVRNEAAATGLHSLKTTGRTAPWNTASLPQGRRHARKRGKDKVKVEEEGSSACDSTGRRTRGGGELLRLASAPC